MSDLEARFRETAHQYQAIKNAVVQLVTTWEWGSSILYELEPFYFEIHETRPGQKLRREPIDKDGCFLYGLDSQQRVTIACEYVEIPGQCYEQFITYKADSIESVLYDYHPGKKPINVDCFLLRAGKIVSFERFAIMGTEVKHYEYVGDQLVKIRSRKQEHGCLPLETVFTLEYDSTGLLSIDERFPDGTSQRVFTAM